MPVTAIPFKSPPAFEIPPHMADPIRRAAPDVAGQQALQLLQQVDAGDALAIAWADATGMLTPGPFVGGDGAAEGALRAMADEGAGAFMARAVSEAKPWLFMGEVAADDPEPFPPAFKAWLLGGSPAANIGFLYVYPLLTPDEAPRGALMIHRSLAAGPLNHDQPAIAHAIARLLGEAAAGHP